MIDKNYCPECGAFLPGDPHKPMCSVPERNCQVANLKTQGRYYCTRKPGHDGPCAARPALSRNSEVLTSFVNYCKANPQLRFWQALLNWSGLPFIVISSHPPSDVYAETRVIGQSSERVELIDPYNWEGRNG